MGIQDLTKTIKKHAPNAIEVMKPSELPGTTYGVDVFSYLYPAKYNPGAKGKGQHLRFFIDMLAVWKQAGKTLVMVIDGDTSKVEAKQDTIAKRKELREQSTQAIQVTEADVSAVKRMFNQLNVKYYQARGEADTLLASLYEQGVIDGVISEDSDLLTHGIGLVVRGLIDASNRSAGVVNLYKLKEVLTGLQMSQAQFVDFCILCGCDYCPRISGVGPVAAHKHIASGGTPVTLPQVDPEYIDRYQVARLQFTDHTSDRLTLEANMPAEELDFAWILSETNYTETTLEAKLALIHSIVKTNAKISVKIKPVIKPRT